MNDAACALARTARTSLVQVLERAAQQLKVGVLFRVVPCRPRRLHRRQLAMEQGEGGCRAGPSMRHDCGRLRAPGTT